MGKLVCGIVVFLSLCAQGICTDLDYTTCKSWDEVIQLETKAIETCTDDLDLAILYSKRGTSFLFKEQYDKAQDDLAKASDYVCKIAFSEKKLESFLDIYLRYCLGHMLICDHLKLPQKLHDELIDIMIEILGKIPLCSTCPMRLIKTAETFGELAAKASKDSVQYTILAFCKRTAEHAQKQCDLLKQH
jgi:hypothetical protein